MGELAVSRYSLDTEIRIPTGAEEVSITPRDVLQWLQPLAPPHECLKFLMISRAMGLNPFTKEIYLADFGGQWVTMVDKAGWIKKAEQHPQYDGFEAGIIYREVITPGASGRPPVLGPVQQAEGTFLPANHIVVGGWAKVYRKDRSRPTFETISTTEYGKSNRIWQSIPCTMLKKVALVHALRESGVVNYVAYEEDEFPKTVEQGGGADYYGVPASGPVVTASLQNPPAQVAPAVIDAEVVEATNPTLSEDHKTILDLVLKLGIDGDTLTHILGKRGVSRVDQLNDQQAMDLALKLRAKYDQETLGDQLAEMVAAAPAPAERLPDEPSGEAAAAGQPSEAVPVAEAVESSVSSADSSRQNEGEVVQSSSQDSDVTSGDTDNAESNAASTPEAPFDATPDSPKGRRGRRPAMATA